MNKFGRIVASACVFGAVSLMAGMIGGALWTNSGQGPLFGIFYTGPVGTLAGALAGLLFTARNPEPFGLAAELCALVLSWIFALSYTLVFGLAGALCQALVIAAAAWLFVKPTTRLRLPQFVSQSMPLFMAAAFAMLLMTLFPPVIQPWWDSHPKTNSAALPKFAFIRDSRLDGSRQVPELTVDRPMLLRNWFIAIGFATAAGSLIAVIRSGTNRT